MTTYVRLRYIHDAGHGWLEVNRALLNDSGVAKDISNYSYQSGNMVYLEEDCDAGLFVQALKEKDITIDQTSVYTERFIGRDIYDRYTPN